MRRPNSPLSRSTHPAEALSAPVPQSGAHHFKHAASTATDDHVRPVAAGGEGAAIAFVGQASCCGAPATRHLLPATWPPTPTCHAVHENPELAGGCYGDTATVPGAA